jgi:tRNA uridine 5-carboxymethylaminomethyl modification enzyme
MFLFVGPRYCPSLEAKILRFGHRNSHNVWLEPEGYDSDLIYPNGISCSLPEEVQEPMMRTIPGLENVKMVRPAYGVEYDHVDARELMPTLETKRIEVCCLLCLPNIGTDRPLPSLYRVSS